MKALIFERCLHENYHSVIQLLTSLLSTTVKNRTKVAPAQIIFGNSVNLVRRILITFNETTRTIKIVTISLSRNTDSTDIARRDHLEFHVRKTFSCPGDLRWVSNLTFWVRWLGYDESCQSEELWEYLQMSNWRTCC